MYNKKKTKRINYEIRNQLGILIFSSSLSKMTSIEYLQSYYRNVK